MNEGFSKQSLGDSYFNTVHSKESRDTTWSKSKSPKHTNEDIGDLMLTN